VDTIEGKGGRKEVGEGTQGGRYLVALHAQRRLHALALRQLEPVPSLRNLGREGGREGGKEGTVSQICLFHKEGREGGREGGRKGHTLFSTHSFSIIAATAKASVYTPCHRRPNCAAHCS